jgi:hypothetical protein
MKRLFWLTLGAGLGAWGLHKAQVKTQQLARNLTPQSLAVRARDRAVDAGGRAGGRLRAFAADVRIGMAEREAELREAVELDTVTPEGTRRRVLRAQNMIINDDKDGH